MGRRGQRRTPKAFGGNSHELHEYGFLTDGNQPRIHLIIVLQILNTSEVKRPGFYFFSPLSFCINLLPEEFV